MAGYVWIPYANGSFDENTWLRIGYNSVGRDAWISTYNTNYVKCAYILTPSTTPYSIVAAALSSISGRQTTLVSGVYNTNSWSITLKSYTGNPDMYCGLISYTQAIQATINQDIPVYQSEQEAYIAFDDGIWTPLPLTYPITYRPTNCSFPNAPTEAAIGDTVVVPVTFPDGYGIVNESDIYVTNNGVVIPSTYINGQLTFTMPDPS